MIGRVACGLQGHVWTAWLPQRHVPTKERWCARCRKRETYWLTASDYRRSTIPRIEFEHRTIIQRSWATLTRASRPVAGSVKGYARKLAGWLTAAHTASRAWCRYAAYVARSLTTAWQVDRKLGRSWWKPPTHAHPLTRAEWERKQIG